MISSGTCVKAARFSLLDVDNVEQAQPNRTQVSHSYRSHRRTAPGAASVACHPGTGANMSTMSRDST